MLELVDITKTYSSPAGTGAMAVLKGVALTVANGGRVAVVGPSGSGKSTLLNIIGGLDHPTSGRVVLDGRDLAGLSDADLAQIRNKQIGFVFQLHHLLPQCTVLENVMVPSLAGKKPRSKTQIRQRAVSLLERVGLKDRMLYKPGELSGGERQRVAVARALINGPTLLLADEPTGSLDEENSRMMAELLLEMNVREGVAIIVVTHSLRLAEQIGSVMELRNGVLHKQVRT